MTRIEMEKAFEYIQCYTDENSIEYKILKNELDCRNMINSCVIYNNSEHFRNDTTNKWGHYAEYFIKELGEQRVLDLWEEQKKEISEATIIKNAYTDSEGIYYNKIIWKDENQEGGN